MIVEEIHKVEEAALVVSLKLSTRTIDSLQPILIFIRSEFIVVDETPRQRSNDFHAVKVHGFQSLCQECLEV